MAGAVELRIRGCGNFALPLAGQHLLSCFSAPPPRVSHLHGFDTEAGCDRKLVCRCFEGVEGVVERLAGRARIEGAFDALRAAFPD